MNKETIFKNIVVGLTGVGLLVIAGQLLFTKLSENRARFLFTKPKTTSEQDVADIAKVCSRKI